LWFPQFFLVKAPFYAFLSVCPECLESRNYAEKYQLLTNTCGCLQGAVGLCHLHLFMPEKKIPPLEDKEEDHPCVIQNHNSAKLFAESVVIRMKSPLAVHVYKRNVAPKG
jgi:hypothetical protein